MENVQLYLDPVILRLLGLRAIALITIRTQQGRDAEGKAFAPYSTKPFAMPAGGLTQRAKGALEGKLSYFRKPHGALWVVIQSGYAGLKQASYNDGSVNLTATGGMLRALTIVGIDSRANLIRIGFTRQEEAEKALWHNETGAGKGKTIREFLGLTREEVQELMALAATRIEIRT